MKVYLIYLFVMSNGLFLSCRIQVLQNRALPPNKFSDTNTQSIYTFQDERKAEALLPYLQNTQARYRREAAMALASVQAKTAVPDLVVLLADPDATVRQAAAYALGQVGETSAEEDLIRFAEKEKVSAVRAEMAEALGKCATQKGLDYLSQLTWPDETEKVGLAWGLYRANAKNLNYASALLQAINLIAATQGQPVRLAAAHFLARTPKLHLNPYQDKLLVTVSSDPSPEVRMAATLALGKIKSPAAVNLLLNKVQQDSDYRVRINAIRALSTADYSIVKKAIFTALEDKNLYTAVAAADFFLAKAPATEAVQLLKRASGQKQWRVRATLLAAALKNTADKGAVTDQIKQHYAGSANIYEKGALLAALGQNVNNYSFIRQETFSGTSPILASYGLQALADMRQQENFPLNLKAPFAAIFRQALESGDGALVGIAAGLLATPALGFKEAYPDPSFLQTVRAKLELPRDMETYQELDKAIRYLEGLPPGPAPQNPFTHPINWALVKTINPQQKVLLKTAKGNITLTLFTEEAPATVANFVQLAQAGFFNQKNFHRVVPNFVVQGGDPRGDGWGGTDYAIRSELANLRYGTGYVGMASAGKDTESCQWFITHSPTPHLDGRYTIFARVTAGLEVVHQLEIGDILEAVELI